MTTIGAQFRSLRDVVVDNLRERIIEGELEPGRRLVERDLATELDVSRITLREALQQLASEGLVTLAPRRGAWVSSLSLDDVHHLFDVRVPLEVLAARSAALRRTDADLERLEAAVAGSRTAVDGGDPSQAAHHNVGFHLVIVEAAANPVLTSMIGSIAGQLQRLFRLAQEFDDSALPEEHAELLDALRRGDADEAGRIMHDHIEATRQPTLDVLARRG